MSQDFEYSSEIVTNQLEPKKEVHRLRQEQATKAADQQKEVLPQPLKRSMQLALEKGTSSWLTSLPIARRIWICST